MFESLTLNKLKCDGIVFGQLHVFFYIHNIDLVFYLPGQEQLHMTLAHISSNLTPKYLLFPVIQLRIEDKFTGQK